VGPNCIPIMCRDEIDPTYRGYYSSLISEYLNSLERKGREERLDYIVVETGM